MDCCSSLLQGDIWHNFTQLAFFHALSLAWDSDFGITEMWREVEVKSWVWKQLPMAAAESQKIWWEMILLLMSFEDHFYATDLMIILCSYTAHSSKEQGAFSFQYSTLELKWEKTLEYPKSKNDKWKHWQKMHLNKHWICHSLFNRKYTANPGYQWLRSFLYKRCKVPTHLFLI